MARAICLIGNRLVAEDDARIPAFDRGFLYGDGVFETLRVYGGRPFLADRHLARMRASAAFFGLPEPPSDLGDLARRVCDANALTDGVVRITWSRGPVPKGPHPGHSDQPTLVVHARGVRADLDRVHAQGVEGRRLPWPLRAAGLPLHRHKTLAYLSNTLALGAVPEGVEAVVENTDGNLAETATGNLFWVLDGRLETPHVSAGCLPGITRDVVLELTNELGLPAVEGHFGVDRLVGAGEAFVTNAAVEIVPLVKLDEIPVGGGRTGRWTRQFQDAYQALVASAGISL